MNFRNFWRVTISTNDGLVSFGEICFLPNFSMELPIEMLKAFTTISRDWEGKEVPTLERYFQDGEDFSTHIAPNNLAFALEAALFVLCVRVHGWIESKFLTHEIPLCGFIPPTLMEKKDAWKKLVERGFVYFKCKMTTKSDSKKLMKMVRWLLKTYPQKNFQFRLDCNQRFSPQEWRQMALEWRQFPVEYWEEPLRDEKNLYESMDTPLHVRYAVDESFRSHGLNKSPCGPDVIVIKPSIWQGFRKCYRDLEDLCLLYPQKKIVLSASYEVSVGMVHLCLLHQLLGLQTHCGFDIDKLFTYTENSYSTSAVWELHYKDNLGFYLRGKDS